MDDQTNIGLKFLLTNVEEGIKYRVELKIY